MTEETPREALARQYQNGGISYAEFERRVNEMAVAEFVPERTEPMPEDTSGADLAATEPGATYNLTPDEAVEQATFEQNVQSGG
jgi:hypothetical protein